MPSPSPIHSCWREVKARVHVALSPQELAYGARRATKRQAFESLFMRYSPELGGVAVAQNGTLKIKEPAKFVGASPYAHVVATAKLLVFAPRRGAELNGIVTHVGPDHVAMKVLGIFQGMLPLAPLKEFYQYEGKVREGEWVRKWKLVKRQEGFERDVEVGKQIRFVVDGVAPSSSGLFQIMASLNEALRNDNEEGSLGVLEACDELCVGMGEERSLVGGHEVDEGEEDDMEDFTLNFEARSAKRLSGGKGRHSLSVLHGTSPFGDALMPTKKLLSSHSKKRKESSSVSKGNSKEGSGATSKKRRKNAQNEATESVFKDSPGNFRSNIDEVAPVLTQADSASKSNDKKESKKERSDKKKKKKKKKEKEVEGSSSTEKRLKKKKDKRRRQSAPVALLYGVNMSQSEVQVKEEKQEDTKVEDILHYETQQISTETEIATPSISANKTSHNSTGVKRKRDKALDTTPKGEKSSRKKKKSRTA